LQEHQKPRRNKTAKERKWRDGEEEETVVKEKKKGN
jgi:hypothetical protein